MCNSEDSPRIAVRVVLRRDGDRRILLLQRALCNQRAPDKWEIPGGVANFLEGTLPALKREAREETGFIIYPSHTVSLTTVTDGCFVDHIFLCTAFRRAANAAGEVTLSFEHKNYCWATVEEALDLDLTVATRAVMEFLLE